LPVAADAVANKSSSARTWGARQAWMAVCLIAAALLLSGAVASWYFEPKLPKFSPTAQNQMVDNWITKKSPADLWLIWTENYRQLGRTGFTPMQHQMTDMIQQVIDQHRRIELALLALAALFGVIASALWLSGSRPLEQTSRRT
jgi:hypothetical protein